MFKTKQKSMLLLTGPRQFRTFPGRLYFPVKEKSQRKSHLVEKVAAACDFLISPDYCC